MIEQAAMICICHNFNVEESDLKKKGRATTHVLKAKSAYCTILKMKSSMTLRQIGDLLGAIHHTTVLYYLQQGNYFSLRDKDFEYRLVQCYVDIDNYFKAKGLLIKNVAPKRKIGAYRDKFKARKKMRRP